jgi:hypothetical protein
MLGDINTSLKWRSIKLMHLNDDLYKFLHIRSFTVFSRLFFIDIMF